MKDQSVIYDFKNSCEKRTCLMCGATFKSNGIGNRRCKRCERLVGLRADNSFTSYRYKVPSSAVEFRAALNSLL